MTGTPLEAVAEAIADNLASQSEVADVPDRYVDWIDPDELAAAAVDALQLTEESVVLNQYGACNGDPEIRQCRLVGPWVVQPERNQP